MLKLGRGRASEDDWRELLEEVDEHAIGLTEWEVDFIESLTEHKLSSGASSISSRQREVLERIHAEKVP